MNYQSSPPTVKEFFAAIERHQDVVLTEASFAQVVDMCRLVPMLIDDAGDEIAPPMLVALYVRAAIDARQCSPTARLAAIEDLFLHREVLQ